MRLLTQIESLSHILAWTKQFPDAQAAIEAATAGGGLEPELIELPRLHLRFRVQNEQGKIRLYVQDRASTYVLPDRSLVDPSLIKGIPSMLVLCNGAKAIELLVPSSPRERFPVATQPFTTATHSPARCASWVEVCDSRYFLYEVHASKAFVMFKSIGAALHWGSTKLLHREYSAAFAAIGSCLTDMPLRPSEVELISSFKSSNRDFHPDSHACRLKLFLVLKNNPTAFGLLGSDTKSAINLPFCFVSYGACCFSGRVSSSLAHQSLFSSPLLSHPASNRLGRKCTASCTSTLPTSRREAMSA